MEGLFGTVARLHDVLEPSLYVQFGLRSEEALAISGVKTIIIDPTVAADAPIPKHVRLFRKSPSKFFLTDAPDVLQMKADLILLDGTKRFAELVADYRKVMPYCDTTTVVAIDNVFPLEESTELGSNDGWEFYCFLDKYLDGAFQEPIKSAPAGMLLVFGIIADNDQYEMLDAMKAWDPAADRHLKLKSVIEKARADDVTSLSSLFRSLRLNRDCGTVVTPPSLKDF